MIKNYFKIAWRTLVASKGYSAINIGGLVIGMTVAILIGLWIYDELSFNKYHTNHDRIGQVMRHETRDGKTGTGPSSPIPLGIELRTTYADHFKYAVMSTQPWDNIISAGDKLFTQRGCFMQPEGPEMFTLDMVYGNRNGLAGMHSILLAESLAEKLFGNTNPVNKRLKIDDKMEIEVAGVYKDLPDNSTLKEITFIAPWDLFVANSQWLKEEKEPWRNNFIFIYTQIADHTSFAAVSATIKDAKLRHVSGEQAARKPEVFIHPMSKWHLYSEFENKINITSERLKFVWFYGIIGFFVLLLACVNFMNLSTARSEKRAKEVGVRKTLGSERSQLIGQFFCESILLAALALVLSLGMVQLILPWFNGVADKKIAILWDNPRFWMTSLTFTLFTGLLAGSYPALYLSSFKPIKVLKGTFRIGRYASIPRKVLVVAQFTVSIALIIGTIIVYRQIQFTKDRPVGYTRDALLMLRKTTADFNGKSAIINSELKATGVVTEVAEAVGPITDVWSNNGGFEWKGKDPNVPAYFGTLGVSHNLGKTAGWQFVAGRDFKANLVGDSTAFIINEAAAKLIGLQNPVGETVTASKEWRGGKTYTIIGVVKDMVMRSPFEPAVPTFFFLRGDNGHIYARINPAVNTATALSKIEAVFKKIAPSAPFDYKFADDEYALKFVAEERVGKLALFFAVLAIFISCLGLFGLSMFIAERRNKEIGVRKVLGASTANLWIMLSKEFVWLVLIACLVASPLAQWLMTDWLQKYAYRIDISWWMFGIAALLTIVIAVVTVSAHAIKAAIASPVAALRTE